MKKYRPALINSVSPKYIKEDLDIFLEEHIKYCKRELKNKIFDIKELIGYDSLDFFDLGNNQFIYKKTNYVYNNSKLLGIISYLYDEILKSNTDSLEVRNYLDDLSMSEEFFDIMRVINLYYKNQSNISLKNIDNFNLSFINYEDKLKTIETTKHGNVASKLLLIFKTLCNILKDKDCTWQIKHEINSALSYFTLVEDIIEDSADSGIGYIDDLFIGSFVLFDILEKNRLLVKNNLAEGLTLDEVYPILDTTMAILERSTIQHCPGKIINLLGLKGLLSFYDLCENGEDLSHAKRAFDNKIKTVFVDLVKIYLKDFFAIEDLSYDTEIILDTLLNSGSPDETQKLNLFIEIANQISYNKNVEKEVCNEKELEVKATILRRKILRNKLLSD